MRRGFLPNQSRRRHWRQVEGWLWTWRERHERTKKELAELRRLSLAALGIGYRHSTPYHLQTCGKVERFRQTVRGYGPAAGEKGYCKRCAKAMLRLARKNLDDLEKEL